MRDPVNASAMAGPVTAGRAARGRLVVLLGVSIVLSACASSRVGVSASGSGPMIRSKTISIGESKIIVQGPKGFCIDPKTSQDGGDIAFVLLASCQATSSAWNAPRPAVKALLTASVMAGGEGMSPIPASASQLDRFFRSETGRTALSRASDPATVKVLDTFQQDATYFIRASDNSLGVVPGADQQYWRAYFDIKGQIASVSVIGLRAERLAPDRGLGVLRDFVAEMRRVNGVSQPAAGVRVAADTVQTGAVAGTGAVIRPETVAPAAPPRPDVTPAARAPAAAATARTPRRAGPANFWRLGLLRKIFN